MDTSSKYVPFSKGGSFVKWYGNIAYALKLADLWDDAKVNKSVRRGDKAAYFQRCIGWSYMGGGNDKNFSTLEHCVCGTGTPTILIYVPSYTDILRVSFTHKFHRGKISDLVSLLSGRDFETRENLEIIAADSFKQLREGVEAFVNETNFERYLMIVRSTGIIDSSLVRSQNVLNFGYILYLTLRESGMEAAIIETLVRKWIVLSMLTGRYSGSAESAFDYDIKRFTEQDPVKFVQNTEAGELSDAFWDNILVTRLDTSVASSPYFLVYLMAQVKNNARGFLSKQIDIQSLIEQRGDIHHIFPRKYLQKNGVNNRKDYNQIANYVYTQSEINVKIKDNAPCDYMKLMLAQVSGGDLIYGGITDPDDLQRNLAENCIPEGFESMDIWDYAMFLEQRRTMMARYIRDYYRQLD